MFAVEFAISVKIFCPTSVGYEWDKEKFGYIKVENPGTTDKSNTVELGYKHNKMCIEGAYVKVTELPSQSWEIKPKGKN